MPILYKIKQFIPKKFFLVLAPVYHILLNFIGALIYLFPSRKLIIIGVTGTKGKSTTCHFIKKILEEVGHKTGEISTIFFDFGAGEKLNDLKMTMPGRFFIQKGLSEMLKNGCRYAVIETSSEGIKQFRHFFINYDIGVFTNLSPEHLESHGGFEKYKQAKLKFFARLAKSRRKIFSGKKQEKIIVVNSDNQYAKDFLDFAAEKKFIITIDNEESQNKFLGQFTEVFQATKLKFENNSGFFEIDKIQYKINLPGKFNIYNAVLAIAVCRSQNISKNIIKEALLKIKGVPGRMEFIECGQSFKILVDYAYEPESLSKMYSAIFEISRNKIIHILGACGGGRDRQKRKVLGKIASVNADIVILTNEDPYDDDPLEIINEVAIGVEKKEGKSFYKILDRRAAIKKAIYLAQKDDLIIITGKGAEQAMCVAGGKKIPWDDRKIVREELALLKF